MIESYMDGWSNVYEGSNWEKQQYGVPHQPWWLKIERVGKMFAAYASPDGTRWATIVYGEYANMPATVYVGLTVCSYLNGTLNTSTFSHVDIAVGTGGATVVPEEPDVLFASHGPRVQLRWTPSFGATGYNVKRATESGGPYTNVATGVARPSHIDTVTASGTYYYMVSATNNARESPVSAEEKITFNEP